MALVTEPAMDGTSLKSLMINNGKTYLCIHAKKRGLAITMSSGASRCQGGSALVLQ